MNLSHARKTKTQFPSVICMKKWSAQCRWSTLLSDFNFTLVPSQSYSPGTRTSGWGKCVCVCLGWGCIVPEMLMWLWFISEWCQVCPSGWTFSEQPHPACISACALDSIWSGRKVDVVWSDLAWVKSLAWVKWVVASVLALRRHTLDRCCPSQSPAVSCSWCPVQIRFFWHNSCWASS